MEANYQTQIKVGIFAVVGLVILVGSILLLGGGKFFFRSTYTLKVHFDQVQGLSRGSVVSLSGFPVGNVESIQFVPGGDLLEVSLMVDESFSTRITQGSEASVRTQGALGDKYVYITPGAVDAAPLKEGAFLKSGDTKDFIEQIASESEKLSGVGDVIQELNILLKNLNHNNNSQRLIANLTDGSQKLERFFNRAESETLVRLNSILTKIDNGEGTLGALINDPSVYRKISGFLGESKRNHFLSPLLQDAQ